MAANVPISGKIGKAAPTARSGSGSGPLTGPVEDDRASDSESMHDPLPPPHYSKPNIANLKQAAKDASEAQDGGM
jgi:hypothetical protein